ncbi:uncharacterized protein LOC18439448 isoform X2 [Amborella trichopoda]|uniref:uncharacterized protein LOC18439448 isoform X2 n=1 Tax=Amborella trichopoda TaxID=13333 RepID=UPI0005D36BA0|nr:uncharacterized protein LOC18439448 isoform X2 [Amborella trichopoda]|eukprot:XP_011625371.1 uncharacterized protein LOC18439448 isoform X2 [Amborella trichopoda]
MSQCFSIVSFFGRRLHNLFVSHGLEPKAVDIDRETTIHCWVPKAGFTRPVLVLIHGFGPASMWQWNGQVPSLSREFDLVVPDLVFFGESTSISRERSEVFQAVSVIKLLETLGVERYSVAGTSYGGFVAYQMARMCPEKILRVVIASSGVNMKREDNGKLLQKAGVERIWDLMLPEKPSNLRTLVRLAVYRRVHMVPNFFLQDIIDTLYKENREEKKELLLGLTIGKEDTGDIEPLPQEVLIVWGEHDQIFEVEMAFELKKLFGEKTRLEIIKNTAHTPQAEDPRTFNSIIKRFLLELV